MAGPLLVHGSEESFKTLHLLSTELQILFVEMIYKRHVSVLSLILSFEGLCSLSDRVLIKCCKTSYTSIFSYGFVLMCMHADSRRIFHISELG